jgi:divalent metal cation (Fe/Co/Zn/Cd) transporter
MLLGVILAYAGLRLVREAAGGLLDEYDAKTIGRVLTTIEADRPPGLIRVHHLRALRFGSRTHVDAHLVMPEFWPLDRAHALCDASEQRLQDALGQELDVMFHSDPCRRLYCPECEVEPCPVREAPFKFRPPLTADEAERTDLELRSEHRVP